MYPVTERKLGEARFFLRKLQEKAQAVAGDPEEFGFFLSVLPFSREKRDICAPGREQRRKGLH